MEQSNPTDQKGTTQKNLMLIFCIQVGLTAVLAAFFEFDVLPCGIMAGINNGLEFFLVTIMELLTICLIPAALRMFKFERVHKKLTSAKQLYPFAVIRMELLCLPLLLNTVLYYLYMNVAFGYMALILVLCLFFVLPTKARCEAEIHTP